MKFANRHYKEERKTQRELAKLEAEQQKIWEEAKEL